MLRLLLLRALVQMCCALFTTISSVFPYQTCGMGGGGGELSSYPLDITPEVTRVPDRKKASGKHFVKKEYFSFTL